MSIIYVGLVVVVTGGGGVVVVVVVVVVAGGGGVVVVVVVAAAVDMYTIIVYKLSLVHDKYCLQHSCQYLPKDS